MDSLVREPSLHLGQVVCEGWPHPLAGRAKSIRGGLHSAKALLGREIRLRGSPEGGARRRSGLLDGAEGVVLRSMGPRHRPTTHLMTASPKHRCSRGCSDTPKGVGRIWRTKGHRLQNISTTGVDSRGQVGAPGDSIDGEKRLGIKVLRRKSCAISRLVDWPGSGSIPASARRGRVTLWHFLAPHGTTGPNQVFRIAKQYR
jgi:hypothetical protein